MAEAGSQSKLRTEFRTVDPKAIELLKLNARYMASDTFNRLVENIKHDGCLTSAPLCYQSEEGAALKCISGNHRVKASIEAGLADITVQVILTPITNDDFIAKQLSHNALVGLDNKNILRVLWDNIILADAKLYSGLDKEMIDKLEMPKIPPVDMNLDYEQVTILFIGQEKDQVLKVLAEVRKRSILSKENWLESIEHYDAVAQTMQALCTREKIHNYATALVLMARYAEEYLKILDAGEVTQATR